MHSTHYSLPQLFSFTFDIMANAIQTNTWRSQEAHFARLNQVRALQWNIGGLFVATSLLLLRLLRVSCPSLPPLLPDVSSPSPAFHSLCINIHVGPCFFFTQALATSDTCILVLAAADSQSFQVSLKARPVSISTTPSYTMLVFDVRIM